MAVLICSSQNNLITQNISAMKKLYTVTAVVVVTMQLLFYHSSFAQAQTDTTFFTQMNYIFANLDKSKVPYGILCD